MAQVGTAATIERQGLDVVADNIGSMIQQMAAAGAPEGQAERFIRAGYVPLPGFIPFHAAARAADLPGGPEILALGGARGRGKTLVVISQVAIDDCQRQPGLKVLYLRRIMKTAAEGVDDLVRNALALVPHAQTATGLEFPNGSRMLIGGYKDPRDIDKYLGLEYDVIVLEEATQFEEDRFHRIRGSLRTSKANWRPRLYVNANPDGVGLIWFKRLIVDPARKGALKGIYFLDVTPIENPFINPEYTAWLTTIPGALGKAWNKGDWDAFAGMAFPEWSHDRHVIKPLEIPAFWPRWRAVDWGYRSPWCCLWFARHPDTKRIYVTRESYQAELTDRQQARRILDYSEAGVEYGHTWSDPSMWERKTMQDQIFSTADEYRAAGLVLTKGDNDRVSGLRKVRNVLASAADGEPGLQIFEGCTHLIEQLSGLSLMEGKEDVADGQEDHAFDALRYGLTNEAATSIKPPARPNPMNSVFSDARNFRR